jgi:hypothetical protein
VVNSQLEFWTSRKVEGRDTPTLVTAIETDAPPPPVGAIINILRQDYEVVLVDYSIDTSTFTRTYRRNVHLKEV